jgi:transcriptional regulator with XRE-family HTH domain
MQNQSTPIRVSFRTKLKKLRETKGWTQAQTARLLRIQRNAYGAYEQGRCMPTNELLIDMSILWGITIEELVKGEMSDKAKEGLIADTKNFS